MLNNLNDFILVSRSISMEESDQLLNNNEMAPSLFVGNVMKHFKLNFDYITLKFRFSKKHIKLSQNCVRLFKGTTC